MLETQTGISNRTLFFLQISSNHQSGHLRHPGVRRNLAQVAEPKGLYQGKGRIQRSRGVLHQAGANPNRPGPASMSSELAKGLRRKAPLSDERKEIRFSKRGIVQ